MKIKETCFNSIAAFLSFIIINAIMMMFMVFGGYALCGSFAGLIIFALIYIFYSCAFVFIGIKLLKPTSTKWLDGLSINIVNIIVTPLILYYGIKMTSEFSLPLFRWVCGTTNFKVLEILSVICPFVFMWIGMQIKRTFLKKS